MRHLNRNHKFTWKLSGNRERETENEGDDKQFIQMVQWVAPIQNQRLKWKAIEQQKNKEDEEKKLVSHAIHRTKSTSIYRYRFVSFRFRSV